MATSFNPSFSLNIQTGRAAGMIFSFAAGLTFAGPKERMVEAQLDLKAADFAEDEYSQLSVVYSQKVSELFRGSCTFSTPFSSYFWDEKSISFGFSRDRDAKGSTPLSFVWTHIFPKSS